MLKMKICLHQIVHNSQIFTNFVLKLRISYQEILIMQTLRTQNRRLQRLSRRTIIDIFPIRKYVNFYLWLDFSAKQIPIF